jgi:hypothetical protein
MQPTYRALRVILLVIAGLDVLVGLLLLFGTGWASSLLPGLALASPAVLGALLKGIGILAIALGYLAYVTSRDPVRYVAVIDTLIFILLGAIVLEIFAIRALEMGTVLPAGYIITRAIVQAAIAVALFLLRPKRTA